MRLTGKTTRKIDSCVQQLFDTRGLFIPKNNTSYERLFEEALYSGYSIAVDDPTDYSDPLRQSRFHEILLNRIKMEHSRTTRIEDCGDHTRVTHVPAVAFSEFKRVFNEGIFNTQNS